MHETKPDASLSITRAEITRRISDIIAYRVRDDEATVHDVLKIAQKMECYLYKNASSFESYADINTIEARVLFLARSVREKLLAKYSSPCKASDTTTFGSQAETPCNLLRETIGTEKFNQIIQTINELRYIRCTSTVWMSALRYASNGDSEVVKMPQEIQNIYFNRLLAAHDTLTSHGHQVDIECIQRYDWTGLCQEARENIAAFRMFEREKGNAKNIDGFCFASCWAMVSVEHSCEDSSVINRSS